MIIDFDDNWSRWSGPKHALEYLIFRWFIIMSLVIPSIILLVVRYMVHHTECNFAENQYCFWILIWRWDSFVVKKTLRRARKVIIIFLPRSSIKPAPTLYIGMNNKDFPSKYSILDYSMLVTSVYNERRTPWSVKIEKKKYWIELASYSCFTIIHEKVVCSNFYSFVV